MKIITITITNNNNNSKNKIYGMTKEIVVEQIVALLGNVEEEVKVGLKRASLVSLEYVKNGIENFGARCSQDSTTN